MLSTTLPARFVSLLFTFRHSLPICLPAKKSLGISTTTELVSATSKQQCTASLVERKLKSFAIPLNLFASSLDQRFSDKTLGCKMSFQFQSALVQAPGDAVYWRVVPLVWTNGWVGKTDCHSFPMNLFKKSADIKMSLSSFLLLQ